MSAFQAFESDPAKPVAYATGRGCASPPGLNRMLFEVLTLADGAVPPGKPPLAAASGREALSLTGPATQAQSENGLAGQGLVSLFTIWQKFTARK